MNVEFESYFEQGEVWLDARAYPSKDGLSVYLRDITDRKLTNEDAVRAHRAMQLVSLSNEILIRAEREDELLDRVCQISVGIPRSFN